MASAWSWTTLPKSSVISPSTRSLCFVFDEEAEEEDEGDADAQRPVGWEEELEAEAEEGSVRRKDIGICGEGRTGSEEKGSLRAGKEVDEEPEEDWDPGRGRGD